MRGDRQNLKLVALCRHAEYKGNFHTVEGREKLRLAVAWLAKYMETLGVMVVYLATSEVGRAIEATGYYRSAFKDAGLNTIELGQHEGLNPIRGPRGAQKRVASEHIGKSYGKGFMKLWRGWIGQLITGMEKYATVAERTSVVYDQLRAKSTEPKAALVIVGHGGVFEPLADKIFGAKVNDIPPAGIVLLPETTVEGNPWAQYMFYHLVEDKHEWVTEFSPEGKPLSARPANDHIRRDFATNLQEQGEHEID